MKSSVLLFSVLSVFISAHTALAAKGGKKGPPSSDALIAPTDLGGTVNSSSIRLTWTDTNSSERGYEIERSLASQSSYTSIGSVSRNATSFSDTNLASTTAYLYRIRATGRKGARSPYSSVIQVTSATIQDPPPPPAAEYSVVPVILVASDLVSNMTGIELAKSNFVSINEYTRDWYTGNAGGTFNLVTEPIIINTTQTAQEWIDLSIITKTDGHRYDLYYAAVAYVSPIVKPNTKYSIAMYAGRNEDVYWGAAGGGPYAVVGPRATSVSCPMYVTNTSPLVDSRCGDSVYAIGHELGHTFGLAHTCDAFPQYSNCGQSLMFTGKPPNAILFPEEVQKLLQSPYIK